jgi:4-amino-4-deoxy-L-arabinose transferase-like glycosyltransferase
MNYIQSTLQAVEVGKARILIRIIPLLTALILVTGAYDFRVFHGLSDAQSMDNAQLARQIVRGRGYTTEFLRPQAVAQLRDYATSQALKTGRSPSLFPPENFPPGTPRVLPDTYNAPGYPYLLATFFYVIHPEFDQVPAAMSAGHPYSGERLIPLLNQVFMLLTALLVFTLGRRLFDERVAWVSLIAFLGTDMVWHYTVTALSTSFVTFLVTAVLMCMLEIFRVGEACFDNEDRSFGPAWLWGLAAAFLLGGACLTRLNLVALLIPMLFFLLIMPRGSFVLFAFIALVVIGMVTPWFIHMDRVSGNPLGSNFSLVLDGQGEYMGNQIYCSTSIPNFQSMFRGSIGKEVAGFRWNFEHAWTLLGSNPLMILFGASILHKFRRARTRLFHWMLFCTAIVLIAANNLGSANPENVSPWNALILLFPCMLVIGTAFFFILLDRMDVQLMLLNTLIVRGTVIFILAPLFLTLTSSSNSPYSFPPYIPPSIKLLGQYAQPDEWVTSDMPWATAWYADRASLWLPDSLNEFQNFHENVCPTGLLLITPVSWSSPVSNFTTGEYKDWFPLVKDAFSHTAYSTFSSDFPLSFHTVTPPGGPDYALWSDRPRWQQAR